VIVLFLTCATHAFSSDQPPVPIERLIKESKFQEADREIQQKLHENPADARALTYLGDLRRAQSKYLQAEAAYRKALLADPKCLNCLQRLGDLYLAENRASEAVPLHEQLVATANSPTANIELADAYQRSGDFSKSLAVANKVPSTARNNKLLLTQVADYLALQRPDDAQHVADELLHRAVTKPELVPQLAQVFLKSNAPVDAGQVLKIFEHRQKPTEPYLTALADVQARTGDPTTATRSIEQALAINPNSPEALVTAARIAGTQQKWKEAISYLKQLRQVAPPRPDVLQSAIYAYLQVADTQSAYEAALDWQDLQPDSLNSMLALASVYVRGMKMGEAQKIVDKALAQAPQDKRVLEIAGVVRYYLGNMEEAERFLTASLGQGAGDVEAQVMLGMIEKQRGNLEGAAKHLEQAVASDANNLEAFSELGPMYLQLNEPEKARTALEHALRISPNDAQNHYKLAQVYRKLGQNDQARAELELFQKLRPRHEDAAAEQEKH
jgi:tetratricopeptide (TPR) repeat protein